MELLKRTSLFVFLGLLAYMPLHVFLSIWVGTSFDILGVTKILKDVVLLAGFVAVLLPSLGQPWFRQFLRDRLVWLIAAYSFLSIVLVMAKTVDQETEVVGMVYNLRYLVFAIYGALLAKHFKPAWLKKRALQIVLGVAVAVTAFGFAQYMFLPDDILSHVGYKPENGMLVAFHIDAKPDLERANSTIRDPNSYGNYLLIILAAATAYLLYRKGNKKIWAGLAGLAALNLYFTFSRSSWIGAIVMAVSLAALYIKQGRNITISRKIWVPAIALLVLLAGTTYMARDTYFVKNVVLHADESTVDADPNELRLMIWRDGIERAVDNPWGYGLGTAGVVSIRNDEQGGVLTENYYLQILLETGVLGLALFVTILAVVALRLYRQIKDPLALALLLSFIGIGVSNLMNHIWTVESVAMTWWGLAGLFLVGQGDASGMRRRLVDWNRRASATFDRHFVWQKWRVDGLRDYVRNVVPRYLGPNQVVYDIGGGKRPFIGTVAVRQKGVKVVGLDISKHELDSAPKDAYSRTIVADIGASNMRVQGPKADVVICEAVLEHVKDTARAVKNMNNIVKKDGVVIVYVPSRNAPFAVLNRLLPEGIKRRLLHGIFPESQHAQGFPAYYKNCTPSKMAKLFSTSGFEVQEVRAYSHSTYFSFFLPLHVIWRIYQNVLAIFHLDHSESFTIVATKA